MMGALLAMVPVKDWLWAGLVAGLLVSFGVYTVHERHVGAAKIEAATAKVAAIQLKHDEDVQNAAKTSADAALTAYKASELKPIVLPSTRIVCHNSGGGEVPPVASSPGGGNGPAPSAGADTGGFDPTVPALEAGRDADAQIKLLQDTIRGYQAAGVVTK